MWPIAFILTSLLAIFPSGTSADNQVSAAAPQLFSKVCVAWHLSASKLIGQGWVFSGFCKNSKGVYGWDDNNLLDDCVGVDDNGRLTHKFYGMMSGRCAECNDNNGWGHTSSLDHTLVCNCTNGQGETVESSLDLDTTYGYWNNSIVCLATPASTARPPSTARDVNPHGYTSVASVPMSSPPPYSVGPPGFASNCNPRFQVTGNLPHVGYYNPRVIWAECVDNYGVWDNTSLDLGLCFAGSNGFLVPHVFGMFNETCFDCVQNLDVLPATLLCHCLNGYKTTTSKLTTIHIEPTIQVVNGILECFGIHGDRGLVPPAEFRVADWEAPGVDMDRQLSASTRSSDYLEHAARRLATELDLRSENAPQDHCCFWESCSHTISMRQPEPWLFTRCRRVNELKPTLIARFDLSKAFMYDRNDWTIKPGDGLYDDGNGCKDCHIEDTWMYCRCSQPGGNFTGKSIDLNEHISNINGTLCSSSYCGDHQGPTVPITGMW